VRGIYIKIVGRGTGLMGTAGSPSSVQLGLCVRCAEREIGGVGILCVSLHIIVPAADLINTLSATQERKPPFQSFAN